MIRNTNIYQRQKNDLEIYELGNNMLRIFQSYKIHMQILHGVWFINRRKDNSSFFS